MGCCGESKKVRTKKLPSELSKDPIIKSDGSLLFAGAAPRKEGYTHDPENPRRLIIDSIPCVYRMTAPLLHSNGHLTTFNQCNNPDCQLRGQSVNQDICKDCSLRAS